MASSLLLLSATALCMLQRESAGDGPGPQVDTSSGRVCL